jgi:hypothetical protein
MKNIIVVNGEADACKKCYILNTLRLVFGQTNLQVS